MASYWVGTYNHGYLKAFCNSVIIHFEFDSCHPDWAILNFLFKNPWIKGNSPWHWLSMKTGTFFHPKNILTYLSWGVIIEETWLHFLFIWHLHFVDVFSCLNGFRLFNISSVVLFRDAVINYRSISRKKHILSDFDCCNSQFATGG